MNRDELLAHHDEICQMCKDIMVRKNHDYAGSGGDNPFANFTRTEDMGICSAEQGFLVRMTDKMSRLSTFAQCGELKVENESYQDAILDIINYCILLSGYLKQKTEDTPTGQKLTFIQEEVHNKPNSQGPPSENAQISGPGKVVKSTPNKSDNWVHKNIEFGC